MSVDQKIRWCSSAPRSRIDLSLSWLEGRGIAPVCRATARGWVACDDDFGYRINRSTAHDRHDIAPPPRVSCGIGDERKHDFRTAAALVLGCQHMQPGGQLTGVVLNRVGSEGHLQSTAEAIRTTTGLPVLGSLPSEPALTVSERHLGLVPVAEGGLSASTLNRLADLVAQRFDLAAIRRIAASANPLRQVQSTNADAVPAEVRIGVAQDRAFGFYYQDTIDVLRECGTEIVPFSPLDDERLPADTDGPTAVCDPSPRYATDGSSRGGDTQGPPAPPAPEPTPGSESDD